jgi:DNA-binding beta-propeller fold protein YncE
MYASRKPLKMSKNLLIHLLALASVLMLSHRRILASEEAPNVDGAMVLVMEDCDSDNNLSTEPYGDTVSLLNSKGELVKKFRRLGIRSIFNGPRLISASEDGRFFVVCENVPDKLTMYETETHRELWSLWMEIRSAVFANDLIYAVNTYNVFAIDKTGTIVKHARLGGLDIAVDTKHNCVWIVGLDVKKCDLDLMLDFKVKLTLDPTHTGGLSVDINPDGSIWVAEQNIRHEYGSKSQLVKISLDGKILKNVDLDFSPVRVRIDNSDSSVWTTGMRKERDFSSVGDEWPETLDELNKLVETKAETFTCKYDSEGNRILEISEGGYSIDLDQSDGSAWIAGRENILHYSATGQILGSYDGFSDGQKYLTIVPGKKQSN